MKEIGRKTVSDADCRYVLSDKERSGDDSQILIPKNIYDKLNWSWSNETLEITLVKKNLLNALKFSHVYGKTKIFHKGNEVFLDDNWFEKQKDTIEIHFKGSDTAPYRLKTVLSTQDRHYINSLNQESGLNLQEFLIPKFSTLVFKRHEGEVYVEIDQDQRNLRSFCFQVFKIVLKEFGSDFLKDKGEETDTEIGQYGYVGVKFKDYFGNAKLLGIFEPGKANEVVESNNRFRYQKEPFNLYYSDKEFFFTTEFEYNFSNPAHIFFKDYNKFIEDYSRGKYSIRRDADKTYHIVYNNNLIISNMPIQKLYFGSPGSGKSHRIKTDYPGKWPRVTFHPELDYQGFIGAYKPTVVSSPTGEQVTYKFVEESFIRAYCEAWKSAEPYYLIIEEINRGNCAQIFGDIFQLLDRGEDGFSEYPIICSPDVQNHLAVKLKGIKRIKQYEEKSEASNFSRMTLPDNLNILCTMNTSDQSLFPMDSAFKRRWDWHYIPINYKDAETFNIDLGNGNYYNWGKFIYEINKQIKNHTQSEDKQLGNRFVSSENGIISSEQFVSKVVFYLWSEIYKEEQGSGDTIFFSDDDTEITFSDFFTDGKVNKETTRKFILFNLPSEEKEEEINNIAETDSLQYENDINYQNQ